MEQRLQVLIDYGQAWARADDEVVVRSLVDQCWSAASSYVNPFVEPVLGVDGLTRLILDYQVLFPDARITSADHLSVHHDYAYWSWALSSSAPIRIRGINFGSVLTGRDFIRFGDDQRIKSVVAFFDERRNGSTSFVRPFSHVHDANSAGQTHRRPDLSSSDGR